MPFSNNFINMQTPERLYAMCLFLNGREPMTKQEIFNHLQPSAVNERNQQVSETFKLALAGNLVIEENRKYRLNLEERSLQDIRLFKQEISSRAYAQSSEEFSKFTAWAMNRGELMLMEKASDLESVYFKEVTKQGNRVYNKDNITAWQNWAVFLGLGFMHNDIFVPNAANRLRDLIQTKWDRQVNEPVLFREYVSWQTKWAPELDGGALHQVFNTKFKEHLLSFALSSGLRMLHELKVVTLSDRRDETDNWHLFPRPGHEIESSITHITILREV